MFHKAQAHGFQFCLSALGLREYFLMGTADKPKTDGYIQRQCQALCGSTILASALQVIIFTQGHFYQGWIRLVPIVLIGSLLTIVALWRRSLIPGMIAHGFGDGLVAFIFFFNHV
jgi:hypothetical protein